MLGMTARLPAGIHPLSIPASLYLATAQISLWNQDSDLGLRGVRNVRRGTLWRSIPGYHLLIRPPLAPSRISSDHAGMQANNHM